jgi:hypothetical protein
MYSRKTTDSKQEFHLFFDSSPRYAPSATMHLFPAVRIKMTEIGKKALAMTGDPWLLANAPDLIIGHQIQNLAPKDHDRRWFVSDVRSCDMALTDVADCFTRWVEPFLLDYSTIDGLLRQYEAGDRRPIRLHHFFVFIAAGYCLRGDKAKAAQVLEQHLGKATWRTKYARAFEAVA